MELLNKTIDIISKYKYWILATILLIILCRYYQNRTKTIETFSEELGDKMTFEEWKKEAKNKTLGSKTCNGWSWISRSQQRSRGLPNNVSPVYPYSNYYIKGVGCVRESNPALRVAYNKYLEEKTTYTFTNADATGKDGPTQTQINQYYSANPEKNLNGKVTINTRGIQEWTVPVTGKYKIEALGAKGGNNRWGSGGKGAKIQGEFSLNKDDKIKIVVGQMGGSSSTYRSGGGGGSYVFKEDGTILVIAGGGGGGGTGYQGSDHHGKIQQNGANGIRVWGSYVSGNGGNNGQGGAAGAGGNNLGVAGGGAGWLGNGAGGGTANSAYYAGSVGGNGSTTKGGFGGGGGVNNSGAGGGGGYSGGGGSGWGTSNPNSNSPGGGGGSKNNGTNPQNESGANSEHGKVIITSLQPLTTTTTTTTTTTPVPTTTTTTTTTTTIDPQIAAHNMALLAVVDKVDVNYIELSTALTTFSKANDETKERANTKIQELLKTYDNNQYLYTSHKNLGSENSCGCKHKDCSNWDHGANKGEYLFVGNLDPTKIGAGYDGALDDGHAQKTTKGEYGSYWSGDGAAFCNKKNMIDKPSDNSVYFRYGQCPDGTTTLASNVFNTKNQRGYSLCKVPKDKLNIIDSDTVALKWNKSACPNTQEQIANIGDVNLCLTSDAKIAIQAAKSVELSEEAKRLEIEQAASAAAAAAAKKAKEDEDRKHREAIKKIQDLWKEKQATFDQLKKDELDVIYASTKSAQAEITRQEKQVYLDTRAEEARAAPLLAAKKAKAAATKARKEADAAGLKVAATKLKFRQLELDLEDARRKKVQADITKAAADRRAKDTDLYNKKMLHSLKVATNAADTLKEKTRIELERLRRQSKIDQKVAVQSSIAIQTDSLKLQQSKLKKFYEIAEGNTSKIPITPSECYKFSDKLTKKGELITDQGCRLMKPFKSTLKKCSEKCTEMGPRCKAFSYREDNFNDINCWLKKCDGYEDDERVRAGKYGNEVGKKPYQFQTWHKMQNGQQWNWRPADRRHANIENRELCPLDYDTLNIDTEKIFFTTPAPEEESILGQSSLVSDSGPTQQGPTQQDQTQQGPTQQDSTQQDQTQQDGPQGQAQDQTQQGPAQQDGPQGVTENFCERFADSVQGITWGASGNWEDRPPGCILGNASSTDVNKVFFNKRTDGYNQCNKIY